MSRLTGSLVQSAGTRFFFALDSSPGIVAPGVAVLTLNGQVPIANQPGTIFRTPATALLTLNGLSLGAPSTVIPAPAALSMGGLIPGEVRSLTITPALGSPIESPPQDIPPTLITIWTTSPTTALLTLQTLEINVTQGGNIGFVSPAPAHLTLGTLAYTLLLGGDIGIGALSLIGFAPTLRHELTITPDVGLLTTSQLTPVLGLPFGWVDDDPAPPSLWITDRAAA